MNITTCLFTVLGGMATLGHPSETVRLNQLGYYPQQEKVAVVNAGDDDGRIATAKHQTRQPTGMVDQVAQHKGDAIPQHATRRADEEQGHKAGDHHGQEGGEDQIQGIGDHLAQPLLDKAHKPDRQQHGENGALIADHGHINAEEVHGLEAAGHPPGIGQRRVGQDAAQGRPQIGVTAKLLGRRKADEDGQNDKGRRAEHIQHDKDGAIRIGPAIGADHSQQTHQQTGGHNRRNDGHKDIRQQAGHALQRIELLGGQIGQFALAAFANAGDSNKVGINLVDEAGTENDLDLAGVAEAALDAVELLDGALVDELVIDKHQA